MQLTDAAIRAAKPAERPKKHFDGDGLFLLVAPSGGKWWRLKYFFGGREKSISLGTYPETSLARARQKRDEARRQIADGIDPSAKRKAEKDNRGNTFEAVATEWLESQRVKLQPATLSNIGNRLKALNRHLRAAPIDTIKPKDLLDELRKFEARGRHDTAKRTRADCGRVFRYAIATSRASRDITADIRGLIATAKPQHLPALTRPAEVAELLRDIWAYNDCHVVTHIALKLTPYLFVRPGELRAAEWSEIDLKSETPAWRIAASKMKMRRPHLVPLSRQAVELFRELDAITGDRRYAFSVREADQPMSENTVNMALRMAGHEDKYSRRQSAHGFRSIASTLLNELGEPPDLIELQLAHVENNKSRAAYNRAERLEERRAMMQRWADYLDSLRAGSS
jgi:integrase